MTNLIDWQNIAITSPPLLGNVEVEELKEIIKEIQNKNFEVPHYPCHTQAVERCVKLVTEVSLSVISSKTRNGFIKTRLESRKLMIQL